MTQATKELTIEQIATTKVVICGQATSVTTYTEPRLTYNRQTQQRELLDTVVLELVVNNSCFVLTGKAAMLAEQRGVVKGAYVKAVGERTARISYGQDNRHATPYITTRNTYGAPIKGIGAWKVRS